MVNYDPYNRENWSQYFKTLSPYFDKCKNASVLEIGAGTHTNLILNKNPKNLTLIEPNILNYNELIARYSNICDIINDDIFFYLEEKRKFDVVICCGVIYHFHSPFWLLELIVNKVGPKTLIIETFSSDELRFRKEEDNKLGNRQIKQDWKSCKLSLLMKVESLVEALKNLGYNSTLTKIEKPGFKLVADLLICEKI